MGVLDDAIREHLELKRQHGASADEVSRQEQEALGATQGQPVERVPTAVEAEPATVEPEPEPEPELEPEPEPDAPAADPGEEDVLEETPEFLQETPEHDRLWFEQKPPREFDFDDE